MVSTPPIETQPFPHTPDPLWHLIPGTLFEGVVTPVIVNCQCAGMIRVRVSPCDFSTIVATALRGVA